MEKYKKNHVYRPVTADVFVYIIIYTRYLYGIRKATYDFNDFSTVVSHSPALAKCTLTYGIHIGSSILLLHPCSSRSHTFI